MAEQPLKDYKSMSDTVAQAKEEQSQSKSSSVLDTIGDIATFIGETAIAPLGG